MATVIATLQILASGDDVYSRQSGNNYGSSGTNLLVQDANANVAWTTGYRFRIPSSIPAADITDIRLVQRAQSAAAAMTNVWHTSERVPAATWADNATHRPIHRQTAAIAAGSTARLGNIPATTANVTVITSPDLSVDIKAAMAHGSYVAGTSYVSVIVSPRQVAPSTTLYVYASESGTPAYRPYLEVTYTVTPINGSASVSGLTVTASVGNASGVAYTKAMNIDYQNGTALAAKDTPPSGTRFCDIYTPQGTAPVGGWPVILWIHGGFFTSGSRAALPIFLRTGAISRGYAVVSMDYRLVEIILSSFEYLANGNEISFPAGIHDAKVLLNFLRLDQLGAQTYNINVQRTILAGYSAGGHIAQFVAYSQGDTTTYEGLDSVSWNLRPAPVGRTNNTTNYYYDFNQNGMSGIDDFTVEGLFLFAGATSLQRGVNATHTPNADARLAISSGRRAYLSRAVDAAAIDSSSYGELNVDEYLSPTAGTPTPASPYLGRPAIIPDFPIGYVGGTSDVLVTKAAGYTPIEAGLIANGYISGAPTLNATSDDKLSYYEVPGVGHDPMEYNITGIYRFFEWMDAITGAPPADDGAIMIGGDPVTKMYVGSDLVTAVYVGSDLVWTAP